MASKANSIGERLRGRLGPSLLLASVILAPAPALAQAVAGVLLDAETDAPIPFGKVTLLSVDAEPILFTVSKRDGRFELEVPGPGEVMIYGEAFYYLSVLGGPFLAEPGDTVSVELRLAPNPEMLDPIVVEARRLKPHLLRVGFYERRDRGFGRFLTREDMDKKVAVQFSDLLRGVHGVRLVPGPFGTDRPVFSRASITDRLRGRTCSPMIYLDGISWGSGGMGIELDDLVPPGDVEAIELYANALEAPGLYGGPRARCGVIVIWTRR
jgi:hypothetical protein